MASPTQPRAAAQEAKAQELPEKASGNSPTPSPTRSDPPPTRDSTPPARLPSWPPANQAAYYAFRKLVLDSHSDPMTSICGSADEATRNEVMAEVFRPNYYQWRLDCAATAGPSSPLVTFSHVRTAQDLASMLFHLQVAVAVDWHTQDLGDAFGGKFDVPAGQPMLFVDAAGDRLGAHARSSVTMVNILVRTPKLHHLYLVDVLHLGGDVAFDTEAGWIEHRDFLAFNTPLQPSTMQERYAMARGEWTGLDGSCFAPVEVAVGSLMPFVPAYRTPRTPWTPPGYQPPGPSPPISLRRILEASGVTKVFFDARHDANVLLARHQIRLRGALDLQLIEIATRTFDCVTRIRSLDHCLRIAGCVPPLVMYAWCAIHEAGRNLFTDWEHIREQRLRDLARPGANAPLSSPPSDPTATHNDVPPAAAPASARPLVPAPFARRPLDPVLLRYAINNVAHLPALFDHYRPLVGLEWMPQLATEMVVRTVCVDTANESRGTRSPWHYPTDGMPIRVAPIDMDISEEIAVARLPADLMATISALRNATPPFLRGVEPARPSRSARRRWARKMAGR